MNEKIKEVVSTAFTISFSIFILLIIVGMAWVGMSDKWCSYIVGYYFAAFFAHFLISPIIKRMQEINENKYPNVEIIISERWQVAIIGCLERALYVAAIQLDHPEFIAVWLGLRLAGQWRLVTQYKKEKKKEELSSSLATYNKFLIGNALSIGYAVVGAKYIEWCLQDECSLAIGIPIILFLATSILLCWVDAIYLSTRKRKLEKRKEMIKRNLQNRKEVTK